MNDSAKLEALGSSRKTTIGFIGLGIMGEPMARNLVRAGFEVVVFNRSPGKIAGLVAAGCRQADGIKGAAMGADVVITMLPDSPDVDQVVLGADGVLEHLPPGGIFIDMSTVQPSAARKIAASARQRGIEALDAPVSGGQQAAIDATLSIMVGGDKGAFGRAELIFKTLGSTIVHVGPSGTGQIVKAANQMLVAGTIALVAEALIFLGVHDINPTSAIQVLASGLAGNRILDRKASSMLDREFTPGFRIDLHHKDLGIALAEARDCGVVLPVSALVTQLMAAARAEEYGSLDHTALFLTLESLSGVRGPV